MLKYEKLVDIFHEITELLKPPDRLTVSQAAEKYRYINNPGSYVGPYKNDMAPYLVEIMDVLTSNEHTGCAFVKPVQCGGTEVTLSWASYSTIVDPADMLMFHPTQSTCRDFSVRRLDKTIRNTPEMKGRMVPRRDANNKFDKLFRAGVILTLAWPSPAETAGRPVGRQSISDLDRIPDDIGGEGNVFDLVTRRGTTFGKRSMTYGESTPGKEPHDLSWSPDPKKPHELPPCTGVVQVYNRGDRRRWFWPCLDCDEYFRPTFDLFVYDDEGTPDERGSSVLMSCPHCGSLHGPEKKVSMNRKGLWVKEGQTVDSEGNIVGEGLKSSIASFHLTGPAAGFASWPNMVTTYIRAEEEFERTGSQESLKVFYNTDLGDVYFPRGIDQLRTPEDLMNKAEDLGDMVIPEDVRFLVACVDVQKSHFVVQVHGIAPGADIYIVDRFNIYKSERFDEDGDRQYLKPASYLEDWDTLTNQVLLKRYRLCDGSGYMSVKAMAYDTGGLKGVTTNAYKYYRNMRKEGLSVRLFPIKGSSSAIAPRAVTRYPDSGRSSAKEEARGEIPVLTLNTNLIKDNIDTMLDREDAGGGMIHFPDWLPENFYAELCAEIRNEKGKWENPKKRRNEAFDLVGYCKGVLIKLGVERLNWDDPPIWADVWANNPLVTEEDQQPFKNKSKIDLKSLAEKLG